MLFKYDDMWDEGVGEINFVYHSIDIKTWKKTVMQRPCRPGPSSIQFVCSEVEHMLNKVIV